jgi:transcription-repair coupling factor (superfamily II helicase)
MHERFAAGGLFMSLSAVREMSLITTPQPLRRPIKTHIAALDEEAVRSAIRQELDRGGQIFTVVPRVEGIEEVAFNAGEADLLLCSTIVVSRLDIPRVNTILIEDAQKFGLAQLYQLRGRVGRSGI